MYARERNIAYLKMSVRYLNVTDDIEKYVDKHLIRMRPNIPVNITYVFASIGNYNYVNYLRTVSIAHKLRRIAMYCIRNYPQRV